MIPRWIDDPATADGLPHGTKVTDANLAEFVRVIGGWAPRGTTTRTGLYAAVELAYPLEVTKLPEITC